MNYIINASVRNGRLHPHTSSLVYVRTEKVGTFVGETDIYDAVESAASYDVDAESEIIFGQRVHVLPPGEYLLPTDVVAIYKPVITRHKSGATFQRLAEGALPTQVAKLVVKPIAAGTEPRIWLDLDGVPLTHLEEVIAEWNASLKYELIRASINLLDGVRGNGPSLSYIVSTWIPEREGRNGPISGHYIDSIRMYDITGNKSKAEYGLLQVRGINVSGLNNMSMIGGSVAKAIGTNLRVTMGDSKGHCVVISQSPVRKMRGT